ncbi:hypothetical protein HW115_18170 [Verrucomicrobiaceae bacterium N1E253]|uniref:Lipoprotein n=1 Tax=Oceaniferula marina TaxID=2748318 RepID=A0A851GRZ8_9BACT|nr:hypothetical protein [Oceaniferula marina]NWK57550.1 hypothetical protein [Oceaniferula marina]
MKSFTSFCCLLALIIAPACSKEEPTSQTGDDPSISEPKPQRYKQWHDICLSGKSKQIDAQIAKFEAQLKQDPKDYLAQVYLGSACALRSKASFWGPSKLRFLKRGQQLMDQAVEKAPNDHRVRMVRAIGSYKVPKKFNRRPLAIKDFNVLVPAANNRKNDLAINERQAILYYAYLTYKEADREEAAKVKAACHKLAPDSEYGKLTR